MLDPHSSAKTQIPDSSASRVFVESEFAPLRTVVLARSQVRLSDPDIYTPKQWALESSIMLPEQRATMMALLGRDHADAMPARPALWEGERAALAAVFQNYGITVLHPRMLTQWEKLAGGKQGYSNSFVRDPGFTVGDVVIEASLRSS